jgi:hypothetical protein
MKTNTEEMPSVVNRITLRIGILNDNERKDSFCRELSINLTKKTNSTYSVLITNSEAYAKISVKNTANKSLTSNDIYDAMINAISSVFPIISSSVGLFDLVLYDESGFTIYV